LDIISWDTYPTWHKYKEDDMAVALDNSMQHDFMRSLQHKPYLMMESCPSSTNWQSVSKLKKPGLLHAQSMQAIAHGADSVQYFQIRQSRGSSEKFHGAVIDHYGKEDTRVFKEVEKVGMDLASLPKELLGSTTKATAALIYDVENRWAMEGAQGPRNKDMGYKNCVLKFYKALKKMGLDVDVVDCDGDISTYEIVAAPMLYMYRNHIEEKLENFVAKGGVLLGTYFSGVVDEEDLCFLGETPYNMHQVFGLRREEIDGLYDWEEKEFVPEENALGLSKNYKCKNLFELIQVKDAEVLMRVRGDFYEGHAALTRKHYKKGWAYMIAGDAEDKFYCDFTEALIRHHQLFCPVESPLEEGLILTTRETLEKKFVFVQNFSHKEKTAPKMKSAKKIFGDLAPFGTAIFEIDKLQSL
ncbi:MAG: beta-galactosidase trimerization domain-containing protein, partial [Lachnospiraceae bacterium]|nr:beta-galactosidase trimerization domain-containing protein [Lachnospiraceae bacterium]